MAKKTMIIIALLLILGAVLGGIFYQKSKMDQAAVRVEEQKSPQAKQPNAANMQSAETKTQNGEANMSNQGRAVRDAVNVELGANEILGQISEVEEYENDSSRVFLTVETEMPDPSQLEKQAAGENEMEEVATVKKTFAVTVDKTTNIIGGTMDDLTQEDMVRIIAPSDPEKLTEFIAKEIEVVE